MKRFYSIRICLFISLFTVNPCVAQEPTGHPEIIERAQTMAETGQRRAAAGLLADAYKDIDTAETSLSSLHLALDYYYQLDEMELGRQLAEESIEFIEQKFGKHANKFNNAYGYLARYWHETGDPEKSREICIKHSNPWCKENKQRGYEKFLNDYDESASASSTEYLLLSIGTLTALCLSAFRLLFSNTNQKTHGLQLI